MDKTNVSVFSETPCINNCYVIIIINNTYLFHLYFVFRIHLLVFVLFASFVLFCFVVVGCFCFVITSFLLVYVPVSYNYWIHALIRATRRHIHNWCANNYIEAEMQLWGTTYWVLGAMKILWNGFLCFPRISMATYQLGKQLPGQVASEGARDEILTRRWMTRRNFNVSK